MKTREVYFNVSDKRTTVLLSVNPGYNAKNTVEGLTAMLGAKVEEITKGEYESLTEQYTHTSENQSV